MKTYSLHPVGKGFCFIDERKASDAIFFSKEQGMMVLMELLIKDNIAPDNASRLLMQIIDLPFFPVVIRAKRKAGAQEHLEELDKIRSMEHVFFLIKNRKKYPRLKVVLCPTCKKHANIIRTKFFTGSFFSKEKGRELIEGLEEDGRIGFAERLRLERQLEKIRLPEKVPKRINPKEN